MTTNAEIVEKWMKSQSRTNIIRFNVDALIKALNENAREVEKIERLQWRIVIPRNSDYKFVKGVLERYVNKLTGTSGSDKQKHKITDHPIGCCCKACEYEYNRLANNICEDEKKK